MCGIAGFFNTEIKNDESRARLIRMLKSIKHRGPDETGLYAHNGLHLGHNRLSIIDIEHGQQPMISQSGRYVISYNGEVFNYRELREELKARGRSFRTSSDTEVLLEGFEHYGIDYLKRLNGQFAFVIYDKQKREIIMARDRFGIRPLFYQIQDGQLIFGSEIKAILANPSAVRKIDFNGIDQIITFWGLIPPQTCFDSVRQVIPGEVLRFRLKDMDVHSQKYWDFHHLLETKKLDLSFEGLKEELYSQLERAVKRQMVSDVPVACYLSGGIDSSVTSVLAQRQSNMPLSSFSVGFEDKDYDESEYQEDMVSRIGTRHYSRTISYDDIAGNMEKAVWHTEAPIFRTAPVPLYLLSELVNENNIKVVLTGEGADEVLWGYDTFKEQKIRNFWRKNTGSKLRPLLLKKLFPYLKHYNSDNYEMLKMFYHESLDYDNEVLYSHSVRLANNRGIKRYYSQGFKNRVDYANSEDVLVDHLTEDIRRFDALEINEIIEFKTLLQGYLLSSQGDRMMMAHSVEGRFPFLDNEIVEFCFRIPARFKMNGIKEKFILRESFKNDLAESVTNRAKRAYMAPDLKSFFGKNSIERTMAVLSAQNIDDAGIWDERAIEKLRKKYSDKMPDIVSYRDNMALCIMLSSQMLFDMFLKNFPKESETSLEITHETRES